MSISTETLMQAREEAETGNDHYSRGFVSEVITELLAARAKLDVVKASEQPVDSAKDFERFLAGWFFSDERTEFTAQDYNFYDEEIVPLKRAWDAAMATKRESGDVLLMLKKYRVAASRMCDRWAEGDHAVKDELWKALHGLELDALEVIEHAEKGQV